MKKKCNLCNKKKNLFNIDKDGQSVAACADCITEQLLTGWSK